MPGLKKRVPHQALQNLDDDDFIRLTDMAASEGVTERTAYRWILDQRYRPYCRKKLIGDRHRLLVPLKIAEAYASARGRYPVRPSRPPGWVGVKQAAGQLGMSPGSVHYRAQQGRIRAVRVGRRVYFDLRTVSTGGTP